MLETLRPMAKQVLANTPGVYRLGKAVYQAMKLRSEQAQMHSRHPGVAFVNYSVARLAEMRAQGFSSQFGQDYYLWSHVFSQRPTGYYIEIGANHPHLNSNSKFLETQGWRGLSFEPLGTFQQLWKETRSNPLLQVAVSSKAGEQDFVEIVSKEGWEHQLSAFATFVRHEDVAMFGGKTYKVQTAPLMSHVAPDTTIDILMIDVEGAEREVLAGIDFRHLRPDYLLVENNAVVGGDPSLRTMVTDLGYNFIARLGLSDDLYKRINAGT
jgi:FkbM family methyltransferase